MSAVKLDQNNFDAYASGDKKLLIDFYADWCGPCRMVSPIVDEIAGERDDVVVCKVNVDENPDLSARFGVYSIPTLIVMEKGQVVNRQTGARPKSQILNMLN